MGAPEILFLRWTRLAPRRKTLRDRRRDILCRRGMVLLLYKGSYYRAPLGLAQHVSPFTSSLSRGRSLVEYFAHARGGDIARTRVFSLCLIFYVLT